MKISKWRQLAAILLAFCLLFGIVGCARVVEEVISGSAKSKTSGTTAEGDGTGDDDDAGDYLTDSTGKILLDSSGNKIVNPSASKSKSGSSGSKTSSSRPATVDTSKPADVKGFGGATVVISKWVTGLNMDQTNPAYGQWLAFVQALEAKYNCKLRFDEGKESSAYMDDLTHAINAGNKSFVDIAFIVGDVAYPSYAFNSYMKPLDGYGLDFNDDRWLAKSSEQMAINGKHYFLAPYIDNLGVPGGVFFNKSLFVERGIADPYTYMANNTWNWDNFKKVAKDMTYQSGGTQYYGVCNYGSQPIPIFATANGYVPYVKRDGRWVYNGEDSRYIKALQFSYDLYNTDKVIPSSNPMGMFDTGKVAMATAAYHNGRVFMDKLGDGNVGFVPNPIGPDANGKIISGAGTAPSL
ncbi:MAG: hypothetical protein LBQ48_05700, partial [Oscillospiraceae bacterium]|nr:hypothetical protein [Oscillospiraceae bacterium]